MTNSLNYNVGDILWVDGSTVLGESVGSRATPRNYPTTLPLCLDLQSVLLASGHKYF